MDTIFESWDIKLETKRFGIGYLIKPLGQGFKCRYNQNVIVKVNKEENQFNEDGYIFNPPNSDSKCFYLLYETFD
jgi:hypothetical protein